LETCKSIKNQDEKSNMCKKLSFFVIHLFLQEGLPWALIHVREPNWLFLTAGLEVPVSLKQY